MSERTDDHVAALDTRHSAAGQFERVVARLAVQDFDRNQHAFLAGDLRVHANLAAEVAGDRDRGDFIDDYRTHHRHPPARVWSMPGSASMREKPTASAAVHSP